MEEIMVPTKTLNCSHGVSPDHTGLHTGTERIGLIYELNQSTPSSYHSLSLSVGWNFSLCTPDHRTLPQWYTDHLPGSPTTYTIMGLKPCT